MACTARELDIQGHRGARGLLPENTLPAFARALEIGVTTLELDCGLTSDGVVVVSHDRALNPDITRGPDGRWLERRGPPIWALTYDELARYDVGRVKPGCAYAKRFPRQEPADGARIPRLADVFALVVQSGDARVRFNIETKTSPLAPEETAQPQAFVDALLEAVRRAGMASRVSVQSFDWRTLKIVQQEAPEIATVYLTAERTSPDNIQADRVDSVWTAGVHVSQFGGSVARMVKAAGGRVWAPYYRDLTRERLREAHTLGLEVVVWTVNDADRMERLIARGVDGIISDYPDVLRRVADRARR